MVWDYEENEDQIINIEIDENLAYIENTDKEVYFSKNKYVNAIYSINDDGNLTFNKYEYNIAADDLLTAYCKHQLLEDDYVDYSITNNNVYLIDEESEEQYPIYDLLDKLHKLLLDCDLYDTIEWIDIYFS